MAFRMKSKISLALCAAMTGATILAFGPVVDTAKAESAIHSVSGNQYDTIKVVKQERLIRSTI
jgi:hypothetical protein